MIMSVITGTIALAGPGAAATQLSSTDVVDVQNKQASVNTQLTVTFEAADGDDGKEFSISFKDADSPFSNGFDDTELSEATLEVYRDGDPTGSPDASAADLTSVSTGTPANSLTLTTESDIDFNDGDAVQIVITDFTTPSSLDDYDADIELTNGQDFSTDSLDREDKLNIVGLGGSSSSSADLEINETVITDATEYTENSETMVEVVFDQQVDLSSSSNAQFNIINRSGGVTNFPTDGSIGVGNIEYDSGASTPSGARVAEINLLDSVGDLKGNATINVTGDIFADNTTIDVTSSTIEDGTAATTSAFSGEQIAILTDQDVQARSSDIPYTVRRGSEFIFQPAIDSPKRVSTVNTSDLSADEYNITFDSEADAAVETLELRQFDFTVTAENTDVDLRESATSATIEATVSSNVVDREVDLRLFDSSGDEIDNKTVNTGSSRELSVEFDVSEEDEYTIEAEDVDTSVVDSTPTITVGQVTGTASLTESVFTQERGDITEVTVELSDTNTANVAIGTEAGQTGIGYGADVRVNDTSGDGEITLELNSFSPNSGINGDAVTLADGDDEILGSTTTTGTADPLDAGTYDLNVSVDGEEEAVSTLSLTALSADAFTILTGAPVNTIEDADASSDYDAFEAAGNLTAASSIASEDLVVHKIEASGLSGVLDSASSSGDSAEVAFEKLLETGNMNLNVTQTDASADANRDPKVLLDSSDDITGSSDSDYDSLSSVNVVADGQNDTYYVAFPVTVGQSVEDGRLVEDRDEFVTNLTLLEGSLFEENVSVTQTFIVRNRSVELDTVEDESGEERIEVEASGGQVVSGETNLAPGSEISIRARSTGEASFLLAQTTEVDAEQDYEAEFDLSDRQVGLEFEVTAEGPSRTSQTVDAVVVESTATPTPEPTASPTPTPEVQEPTETPTATEEPTATAKPGQPGFGIVVALVAILAAALLLLRRD
jgi:PGF-CTERM protein